MGHHHHSHTDATHNHEHHTHSHGGIDPTIATSQRGLWAVKWSFIGLMTTAILQVGIVILSNSIALLADTIHNIGDALTAVPLAIAFLFARRIPTKRFTYGYGRIEDIAGVLIVVTILFSAIVAGYQAVDRFFHPAEVSYLGAVIAASIIGFLGNEGVALFRIKVGKEINSAALIADGYHARVDGWTSLAVLFGAIGVWLGYPLADPLVGMGITIAILYIVWESAKTVFVRMLDGVEPELLDKLEHTVHHIESVKDVQSIRARWIGHVLHAEVTIAIDSDLTVKISHDIAHSVQHTLKHEYPFIQDVSVHIHPLDK
jgi:cation diffusion facilitator family transporter